MNALTISLPDDEAQRLRDLANRLGLSPEELAASAVRERITQEDSQADDFEAIADRVVTKNAELYRRLG